MQTKFLVFTIAALLFGMGTSNAQFLKKLGKRAKEAAEEAVVRKTEEKSSEKTEQTIDTLLNKTKKIGKKKKQQGKNDKGEDGNQENPEETYEGESEEKTQPRLWSTYNFIPGDNIIFNDDLTGEESGEFPSRWDILKGNAENASLDGEGVIQFGPSAIIMPLMDTDSYLPEVFTLEFDAFFDIKEHSHRTNYYLRLAAGMGTHYFGAQNKDWITAIQIKKNGIQFSMEVNGVRKNFADSKSELEELGSGAWRHIALAFNKRTLKIFIDEHRVVNIPNLGFKPSMFSVGYENTWTGDDEIRAIKNIRLAEGGKKLYDRILAEGKFVTRGILFDVNSSTIKPVSGGVLREVVKMMDQHPDLKFRIEGHTDSDGDDQYNRTLSAERAEAVKWALVEQGISEERFETEGKGEAVPISDNTSPEGKANNRRVAFVKI